MLFSRGTVAAQILDGAPYAVVLADTRGEIIYANAEVASLFGWEPEELVGQKVEVLVPAALREAHVRYRDGYDAQPRVRPMGVNRDIEGLRRDGTTFPADIMLSPIEVQGQRVMMAMIRDDSERRQNERRLAALSTSLEKKNLELERHNRELEAFAYTASHDLQEPLRKIVAFGDRVARRLDDRLDDTSRDYLGRMLDAGRRMQTLIDDLLQWSRITTRARPTTPVDLDQLVAATLRDLELAIERSGGRVVVGPLGTIEGDAAQLRTVFQNLLDNALKYRKRDVPPTVEVRAERIAPAKAEQPESLRIEVRDDGIGFDPKYVERIFQMFERLHGRNEYAGTGIGLALCRKIVERHGGTIHARSEPGAGSTFVVTIPTRQPRTDFEETP